ncbi:serine/threonine-protein phosphatase 6 regulatory subunit 3-like isoform X2 [Punica granatum]|uniref:Serine/threonine-protein phosphatase 6 regulatory subunit 3-like isoform X2 n=1 Tax=Punica granatum TaxID=22663 RepID=A0A6P8E0U1_PUNGR|nr:serine/threonine-protein phosphatase 6 regulatory subunit 3-like isoform X2 [Punica granatum]
MFWLTPLSASSAVESVLDKENFSLEDLLDEEEIIQECKALNSRLINYLRDRAQVEQLLRYVVEEPPEDTDSKRAFKFPFIACEIFMCEIDVILKTLAEEQELMDLLFSFLDPNRRHSALLAGYFSKVVICLMLRKTVPLMSYVQAHKDVLRQLVDLIGITSIMEVLVRLVGADDHVYPNFMDVMQWLADSGFLEMIIDKLNPSSSPEVHANAAETLCAITRNAPSVLATKLASPSYVERVFDHALEDSHSKSGLVQSLSVCISLLDPKRSAVSSPLFHSFRSQHMYESPIPVEPETISAMLPKLGHLLKLLSVSSDQKMLPTTYGELRPPLGKHRLKIVEFIAVLMRSGNEAAEEELISSRTFQRIVDLFFEYPYNNALHHQVESIVSSCLESKNESILNHLLQDCDLLGKILQIERHPLISADLNQPTIPAANKKAPRAGNVGHITRIANKLVQLGTSNSRIQKYLQENSDWDEWQGSVLHGRNTVENVYRWVCGRPTTLQDRTRDSDEDDIHDRDYDVAALANNLSQAFRYKLYGNDEAEEDPGALDRDDEDVYFDDESAEVVISSLRFGDDHGSLFTNSNWFAFQDERMGDAAVEASSSEMMEDVNLSGNTNGGNSSSDDEVVVGEEEELSKDSPNGTSISNPNSTGDCLEGISNSEHVGDSNMEIEKASPQEGPNLFTFPASENPFTADQPVPDWTGWGKSSDSKLSESSEDTSIQQNGSNSPRSGGSTLSNGFTGLGSSGGSSAGSDGSQKSPTVPSLFDDDVEFVGVELEGTEKAMEHALKEGIVGEAGPLKRLPVPESPEKEKSGESEEGVKEFNDANYWKVDQEVAALE